MAGKPGALSEKPTALPARYRPLFPWSLDRRSKVVREVAADLVDLWQSLGGVDALSPQELAVCERITFLRRRIVAYESAVMHNNALQPGQEPRPLELTHGEYSNHVNVLLGLLKSIGLGRRQRSVRSLRDVMSGSTA